MTTTPSATCSQCSEKKISTECGLCHTSLCKACKVILDHKDFWLLLTRPAHLNHGAYCQSCFDQKVSPDLEEYRRLEAAAKEVYFMTKNYEGQPHVMARHHKTVQVQKCEDRRQAILMLAYQAAKLNFNALISADIKHHKVFAKDGYSNYEWSGSAMPAKIDAQRLELSSLRRL